jgi:hypothetical protein
LIKEEFGHWNVSGPQNFLGLSSSCFGWSGDLDWRVVVMSVLAAGMIISW